MQGILNDKFFSKKRKPRPDDDTEAGYAPFDCDSLADDRSQLTNKRLREESGPLPGLTAQSSATAANLVEESIYAKDIRQPTAAEHQKLERLQSLRPEPGKRAAAKQTQQAVPPISSVPDHTVTGSGQSYRNETLASLLGIKTPAERMAMRDVAEPALLNRLNPNNVAYDPAFAADYKARRAKDPQYQYMKAFKSVSKLLKRVHWSQKSAFTADDHAYLIDLQGNCTLLHKDLCVVQPLLPMLMSIHKFLRPSLSLCLASSCADAVFQSG